MHSANRFPRSPQTGFSLIELMVGLAIGMLAMIVIIQVMTLFEAQKRTTTGSADAQTNGGIALYSIARELQMAGYPLLPSTDSALECSTVTFGGTGIAGITPVAITDGVAAAGVNASDSITIRYGSSQMGGAQTQITSLVGSAATVLSNLACQANDITVISSGTTCAISKATVVSAAGVSPITVTLANTTGAVANANLACVGAWNEVTYAVNQATGNLERTAVVNGVSTTTPSVVGVVNLQAQYGISATTNSNQVVQWVDASGATWAAPTLANRNRIKAIRIAIVARNAKIEPSAVSAACSSTSAAAPTGLCAWDATSALPSPIVAPFVASPAPTVDLSPADANWARYRYRVFETIIPLRNVIWAKDTL
jgi:type IV pilus assembly protein PilW